MSGKKESAKISKSNKTMLEMIDSVSNLVFEVDQLQREHMSLVMQFHNLQVEVSTLTNAAALKHEVLPGTPVIYGGRHRAERADVASFEERASRNIILGGD